MDLPVISCLYHCSVILEESITHCNKLPCNYHSFQLELVSDNVFIRNYNLDEYTDCSEPKLVTFMT